MIHARALLALFATLVAGCQAGLDKYEVFKDLRVLGLSATPPELLTGDPASTPTQVSALVVNPQGGPVTYAWSLCPVQSDTACLDFDRQLAAAAPAARAALRDLRDLRAAGSADAVADPNTGAPSYAIPPFDLVAQSVAQYGVDRTADLVQYLIDLNLLNQGVGATPSVILELSDTHGSSLRSAKRFVVGVQDLAALASRLLERFGIAVCPPPPAAAPPGCVSFELPSVPRTANSNPIITGIGRATDPNNPTTYEPVSGALTTHPKERLRLRPILDPNALESYVTLRANLQSGTVEAEALTEEVSVSWFCSAGTLQNALTWPKFTDSLDNLYTTPDAPPAQTGGVVTLWLVARDGRGGTSWRGLQINVVP
jgi:hypothetical protein